jgi:hypothetical protein
MRAEDVIGQQDDGEPKQPRSGAAPVQKKDGGEKNEVEGAAGLHSHIVTKGGCNPITKNRQRFVDRL